MEDTKQANGNSPQPLSAEEATSISGGVDAACPATFTLGPVQDSGPTMGSVLTDVYQGFVDVTSQIIERVANAAKTL
jgi:hypothetical protein